MAISAFTTSKIFTSSLHALGAKISGAMKTVTVFATIFTLAVMCSCGSMSLTPTPVQAATTTTLSCTAPAVFRGADDGVQDAIAAFTLCNVNGNGNPQADVMYTLGHDFLLDDMHTWMGTNQGSIEEAAGEVTVEVPTATAGQFKILFIVPNQKDKHQDVEGERIEHYSPRAPAFLPAGSRVVFHMNIGIINFSTNCPLGCGQQLNVYLNGHSSSEGIHP
jgi:hypothetical protein